jgi:glutamate racemase
LIGLFDSGVGGLSILRAIHLRQPGWALHYVADSGHAPYGDRDERHVIERSLRITQYLVDQGVAMVVVACNTATACAIEPIRRRFTHLPLVGVEPGVKPAALASPSGRIGVMATPATLASARFVSLLQRHAADCDVRLVACHGLAAAIEGGPATLHEVDRLLDVYCQQLRVAEVDTVVLGCTHYPFVADRIQARLAPHVSLLDTADAVARQALTQLPANPTVASDAPALPATSIRLQSTGDTAVLSLMASLNLSPHSHADRIVV